MYTGRRMALVKPGWYLKRTVAFLVGGAPASSSFVAPWLSVSAFRSPRFLDAPSFLICWNHAPVVVIVEP